MSRKYVLGWFSQSVLESAGVDDPALVECGLELVTNKPFAFAGHFDFSSDVAFTGELHDTFGPSKVEGSLAQNNLRWEKTYGDGEGATSATEDAIPYTLSCKNKFFGIRVFVGNYVACGMTGSALCFLTDGDPTSREFLNTFFSAPLSG